MDFASLGIKVDSTQVQQAKTDLDALAEAGGRAATSAGELTEAQGRAAAATGAAAQQTKAVADAQKEVAAATGTAAEQATAQREAIAAVSREFTEATTQAKTYAEAVAAAAKPVAVSDAAESVFRTQRAATAAATPAPATSSSSTTVGLDAEKAAASLDKAAAAGEQAARRLKLASDYIQDAQKTITVATKDEEAALASINRRYVETVEKLNAYKDALGKTFAERELLKAEQDGLNEAQLANIRAIVAETNAREAQVRGVKRVSDGTKEAGVSAGQTRAAFQQLHFQVTDIVTGLASGQNPFTVLIQQGGQIKDSFGGIAPTFRALASLITPVNVSVAALGVGVAALAVGYAKGAAESDEFRKSIILSGNASGVTTSSLIDMAAATDRTAGAQYEGAKALAAFAASGKVAAGVMKQFADTALLLEKAVGQSVADTVKQFDELKRSPVEAIAKLNESMHFLDAATYDRIKALQDQGRQEEAAALAQKTYSDAAALRAREVIENFGPLESLFSDIKDGAKRMWDSILNVGREDSLGQQIAKVKQRLAELQSGGAVGSTGIPLTDAQVQFEKARLETLQESLRLGSRVEANNAAAAATAARITENYIEAGKELDKFKTKEERFRDETAKLQKAFEDRAAGGSPLSQAQQDAIIAEAHDKIFGKARKGPSTRGIENAQLQLDVEAIRAAEQQTLNIYQNSEKILDAQRQANLIDESGYYEARREFVLADAKVQIDALKAENDRIAAQKSTGRDRLEQDRQIAKNKAEIVKVQQNADATLEVLAINEGARNKKIADGYKLAEQAARDYLDQVQRAQRATVAAVGLGSEESSRRSAIEAEQQKYEAEKRKLRDQLDTGQITREQFDRYMAIQEQYQSESLAGFRSYYAALDEAQGDWVNGITKGFADFAASSKNVAKTAEQSFTHMLSSVEDAFLNFIMTGKLDWKSLADSIVADILRIIIQAEALQLVKAATRGGSGDGFGSLLQAGLGLFGLNTPAAGATADWMMAANAAPRAEGGTATPGSFHLVNENGPELLTVGGNTYLMMGDQSGYVTPNSGGSWGGMTQVVNFYNNGPIDKRTQMQLGAEVYKQGAMAAVRNN